MIIDAISGVGSGSGTKIVPKPTVTVGTYTYDGTAQGPTITGLDTQNTIVTNATATNAGTYTLTIALKNSAKMVWSDMSTADLVYTYTISKATLTVPTVTDTTKTYNGSAQSPTITGFDSTTMTKTGDSATDAGNYTITFGLIDSTNYEWDTTNTVNWSIAKADQTITLSTDSITLDSDHLTATVTVSGAQGTISAVSSNTSIATVSVSGSTITISSVNQASGNVTITVSAAGTTNYNPATDKTISVACNFMTLVTWANGTDAQIAAMVAAADAGQIDLYQDGGWRVGDERTVSLAAINSSGTYDGVSWSVGESQDAQTITLVLMARDHYTLTTPTSGGRTKCSFVVGVKNCLGTYGYMNSTATNTGSWSSSARRAWCNGGFRQALPSALRGIFKQFKVTTATEYNASTTTDTNDYFALFAEKEIFGSKTYSTDAEANALSSITWYETSSNRIKKQGDSGSACAWWERSPSASTATHFCRVNPSGGADASGANTARGLSPFGCL